MSKMVDLINFEDTIKMKIVIVYKTKNTSKIRKRKIIVVEAKFITSFRDVTSGALVTRHDTAPEVISFGKRRNTHNR